MSGPHPNLMLLFIGVFGVLLVASAAGWLLRTAVAKGEPHAAIDNLIARVNAWWVMVVVLGLAFALGRPGRRPVRFISFIALREFSCRSRIRAAATTGAGNGVLLLLPLQYVLVGIEWYGLYSILIPVYAFLTLPIFASLSSDLTRFSSVRRSCSSR